MEQFITYAHRFDPLGDRFRQLASDPIPFWAIDLRVEPDVEDQHQVDEQGRTEADRD